MDVARLRVELERHGALCQELLSIVEQEGQALRSGAEGLPDDCRDAKKRLLPMLSESLAHLRQSRLAWQQLDADERARHPAIKSLLQKLQDLIMKIVILDRENEQNLLRRGLVPARHLPPARSQQPHFVADLYRRQGSR